MDNEQKELVEIKLHYWEVTKPNNGRVSIVHNKISRKQLERIMAIIHETTERNDG